MRTNGLITVGLLAILALLTSCQQGPTTLDRIRERGELIVVTQHGPTTYHEGPEGPTGFEYELARMFARDLGVEVRFVVPASLGDLFYLVANNRADIAAAGIAKPVRRRKHIRFGPVYHQVTTQLVARTGRPLPERIADLHEGRLEVAAGTSHEALLRRAARSGQLAIAWRASREFDTEQLLYRVQLGELDYTLAYAHEVALHQGYFPALRGAFSFPGAAQLAWAMAKGGDDSLFRATRDFFRRIELDGTLAGLKARYFAGPAVRLNAADSDTFWQHVRNRLPRYEGMFRQTAEAHGLDWRLLAAIGYQESLWDPMAVSPTGVKGLMMLTDAAATHTGIADREDPKDSIAGAARYLDLLDKQVPQRIEGLDRLWMKLAGYNLGFGHLEDARVLTEREGGDPDRWDEVRERLPRLSQPAVYETLKNGFARGSEAVTYVDNIRGYFEMIVWYDRFRDKLASVGSG